MKTIPHQRVGGKSKSVYQVKLHSTNEAKERFEKAKQNLLHVNQWESLAGTGSARFQVVDNLGNDVNYLVKQGNYLRISIPIIPGSPAGNGDDWVIVELIEELNNPDHEYISMRVRPTIPPRLNEQKEVAHFFDPHATSTFTIERKGLFVKASVIGRNEKPNTHTHGITARIRNFFVALGAVLGFNKPQWKSLAKGLVNKNLER
jgi:hypothetical protein